MKHMDIEKNKNEEGEEKEKPKKESVERDLAKGGEHKIEKKEIEFLRSDAKPKSSIWPYFLGLAIGLALVLGTLWFISYRNKTEEAKKVSDSAETASTESNTNSESATANTNAATENSASSTTTPAQTETAPATIDKTKYTLQVQNGNGIKGDAAKVKALLEKDGWAVKSFGNAANFNYANTMVYYKRENVAVATAIADLLKANGRQTAMQESTTVKYTVLVIVGKK